MTAGSSTSAATEARLQAGASTDLKILGIIRQNPGISTYGMAKMAQFAVGRVDGSVSRLLERDEIRVQYVLREGRIVKEIYPKGFIEKAKSEVELDIDLLESQDEWGKSAYVYALDRITIGISPSEIEEWNEKALAKENVSVSRVHGSILVKIPPKLLDFYVWNNSTPELTAVGNHVLVTLKTEIQVNT